jgi:membrane fusion protein (multidrug efflux system)
MRINRWVVVAAVCIGLILALGLIKFLQIRAAIEFGNSFPEPSETVETITAKLSPWQPSIEVIGEVRARREVEIRTETNGIIAKVGFLSGGMVKQGDVLIQLDTAEERAQLEMIKPEVELAKLEVDRLSPLVKKQAVSQQVFDRAKVALAVAKGQEAVVKESIANKTVVAPFDGVTGIHQFEPGQVLGDNHVITHLVGDLDILWVDFNLPQKFTGLKAGVDVFIRPDDGHSQNLRAEVIAVEPNITIASRSVRARAEFPNTQQQLKPGAIVQVSVPVGDARAVFRLPGTAIRRDSFGTYVFVLEKDDLGKWRAQRRPVSIASQNNTQVTVLEGLDEGEIIAAMGSFKLREGILVNISQSDRDEASDNKTKPNLVSLNQVSATAQESVADEGLIPEQSAENADFEETQDDSGEGQINE